MRFEFEFANPGYLDAVIRTIKGVAGVHVMAYRQEEAVAEVIAESGALNGRVPWHPAGSTGLRPETAAS